MVPGGLGRVIFVNLKDKIFEISGQLSHQKGALQLSAAKFRLQETHAATLKRYACSQEAARLPPREVRAELWRVEERLTCRIVFVSMETDDAR